MIYDVWSPYSGKKNALHIYFMSQFTAETLKAFAHRVRCTFENEYTLMFCVRTPWLDLQDQLCLEKLVKFL